MATVKICDICKQRKYPIETLRLFTGRREYNGVETENIYDTYISCLSKFFLHLIKTKPIQIAVNNNLQSYIKKEK